MKNILIIATYFPPMGGIGTVRVTKYVKYLRKFNWNPTVVTISDRFIKDKDNTLMNDIPYDVEIIKLDFKCQNIKNLSQKFYKELKKNIKDIVTKKKYNAVFVTGGPFDILKIAPYIYIKFDIPYIVDLRDPWKLQKINSNNKIIRIKSKIKKSLIGVIEKKVLKDAFAVCTVNDTMTEQYKEEYKKLENRFYTISNGYDKSDYEAIEPKIMDSFSIVYAGKFNVSAGFRDPTNLFKAIKVVNEKGYNVNFLHIGEKENIPILVKKENIEKYYTFLGKKTYKETLSYCKGANILVVIGGTEKSEQTGKIFDYIGCKRPILVLSNGNSEIDIVCQKVEYAYSVNKESVSEIINAIIQIYNNKNNVIKDKTIKEYEREELTSKLVTILEKI